MSTKNEFRKAYIGNGKAVKEFPGMIEVSINMDDAQEHIFEYSGERYLKFTVSPLQVPTKYGKTHTVYIKERVLVETTDRPADYDEFPAEWQNPKAEIALVEELPQPPRKRSRKAKA